MTNGKIFPTRDDERNGYYNIVIPYIDTNKVRLTVSAANDTAILALLIDWNNTYPQAKNKNLSTKTLRDHKDDLIVQIEDTLRNIYADIPFSVLTDADRNTLNLKKRDTTPTDRGAIDGTPVVKLSTRNGGIIEGMCRTDSDSTRASILKDADGAEVVYNVGGTQPVSPSECTKSFFTTKAKFKIQLDVSDAGKKVFSFVRWKNNTDPTKSGPWTKVISAVVSD